MAPFNIVVPEHLATTIVDDGTTARSMAEAGTELDQILDNAFLDGIMRPQCADHERNTCPECEVGCVRMVHDKDGQKGKSKAQVIDVPMTDGQLELVAGETLYMTDDPNDAIPFTWSKEKDTNDSRLRFLAACRGNSFCDRTNHLMDGWNNRFVPQYDEQVQGLGILASIKKVCHVRAQPPAPMALSDIGFSYCADCQATWLIGQSGQGHVHPEHEALDNHRAKLTSADVETEVRSLLVCIDAVIDQATGFARLGVYFGPGSKYNSSEYFYLPKESNNQSCAELHAARLGMSLVEEFLADRKAMLEEEEKARTVKITFTSTSNEGKTQSKGKGKAGGIKGKKGPNHAEACFSSESTETPASSDGSLPNWRKKAGPSPSSSSSSTHTVTAQDPVASSSTPEPSSTAPPKAYHVERPFDIDDNDNDNEPASTSSTSTTTITTATPKPHPAEQPFDLALPLPASLRSHDPSERQLGLIELVENFQRRRAALAARRPPEGGTRVVLGTPSAPLAALAAGVVPQLVFDDAQGEWRRAGKARGPAGRLKKGGKVRFADAVGELRERVDALLSSAAVAVEWYRLPPPLKGKGKGEEDVDVDAVAELRKLVQGLQV
ncbi:hypothetical protein F4780DRAFT_795398 [Xylariomycetidae sp. FL0641]|nr:hypothetical protein F4780DRAFT_795398 [Xylariomycetidae sp. FL0641]